MDRPKLPIAVLKSAPTFSPPGEFVSRGCGNDDELDSLLRAAMRMGSEMPRPLRGRMLWFASELSAGHGERESPTRAGWKSL